MYQRGDKVVEKNSPSLLIATVLSTHKGIWAGNNKECVFCKITYNENGKQKMTTLPDWRLEFASEEEVKTNDKI